MSSICRQINWPCRYKKTFLTVNLTSVTIKQRRCRKMERRMEKISWRDRVRNEEVLRRVGEHHTALATIWKRKMNWIGHIMRGEGMLRVTIEGRVEGKRPRGRKRRMMLDDILGNQKFHEMKTVAQKRDQWKRLSCAGPVWGQTTWRRRRRLQERTSGVL